MWLNCAFITFKKFKLGPFDRIFKWPIFRSSNPLCIGIQYCIATEFWEKSNPSFTTHLKNSNGYFIVMQIS